MLARKMVLLLFLKFLIVGAVFMRFSTQAEANIAACSPSNTNIVIDARVPGEISTPEFPDGSRNRSCAWKIQAPENFLLEITIKVLKLTGADDYLIIRDGAEAISPMIGKYGPCASGSLTLFCSGNFAFLQMASSVFTVNDKLRIAYKPTDPDDIDCSNGENPSNFCGLNTYLREPSGVVSSPNFPNNYGAGRNCLWTIMAPPGYRVQFTIHWLGIEDHRYSRPGSCGDDSISVSEYRGNYTNDVEVLCGCKRLFTFVSFMEKMWVRFSSYKKNNWPGFYATYKALAPEECLAGKTNCSLTSTVLVGFDAQGQVCRSSVKTTSKVTNQETPSLLPSSVNQLAGLGSLRSTPASEIKATVHPTFSESNRWYSNASSSQRTTTNKIKTEGTVSSLIVSPTLILPRENASAGRIVHSSEVIKHTSVSLLRSSNLELATFVTSSSSFPKQTPIHARSSFAMVENSNGIPPIGQIQTLRDVSTSAGPANVLGTSMPSKETEAIKASPSTAPSQNETKVLEETKAIVTTGVTLVREANMKETSIAAGYKTETIKISDTREAYQSKTIDLTEITAVSATTVGTENKTEAIKPNPPTGSYQKETSIPGEKKVKSASTAVEHSIEASKTTRSDGSAALLTKQTTPLVPTSSLARAEHAISKGKPQNFVRESTESIRPSKASKETSTGPQTTPVERPTTQYTQVTGTDNPLTGLEVKCTHYAMEVTISRFLRPHLVIRSLHLQDPSCKVSFTNDTHALLSAPLEECGTQQKISEDYFIYVNTMTGDEKSSKSSAEITRKGRLKFEFQCSYKKLHVLSIVSYSPRQKAVRTADEGVGNFTFEMDMFKDPKYDIVVNQYPVTVHSGQPMYLQVNVKSRDKSLLTFLEECWVTPTPDPRDQTTHIIIKQGCSRDASLKYVYEKSSLQKFTFQAFRFRDVVSERLYVHCKVVTCRRSDTGSVCDRGCKKDRRYRRENKRLTMDKDVFLSLGPVYFQDQSEEESHEPSVYVKALPWVLGALALMLVIAVVVLILRRRNLRGNKSSTWILLATREHSVQEGNQKDQLQIPQAEM